MTVLFPLHALGPESLAAEIIESTIDARFPCARNSL
jgi:hypothetical protein